MLGTLRRFFARQERPCAHLALAFDWYREMAVATCARCGEVFLVEEPGKAGEDWMPEAWGGFDGP